MDLDELIETYYRLAYRHDNQFSMKVPFSPKIPRDMLVHSYQGDPKWRAFCRLWYRVTGKRLNDWVEWRLVPRSQEINPGFAALEREIGIELPYSFKLWHSRYYTLDADVGMLRLPVAPTNDPFGYLRQLIFHSWQPERIFGRGLIAFGEQPCDAGPLCFDTRQPRDDADWPIVYWDHDRAGGGHRTAIAEEQISPVIFSSFGKLLACCVHYLRGESSRVRAERIAGFFEIDPDGAGGPGRGYWQEFIGVALDA